MDINYFIVKAEMPKEAGIQNLDSFVHKYTCISNILKQQQTKTTTIHTKQQQERPSYHDFS